jgi:hypothetical protein
LANAVAFTVRDIPFPFYKFNGGRFEAALKASLSVVALSIHMPARITPFHAPVAARVARTGVQVGEFSQGSD